MHELKILTHPAPITDNSVYCRIINIYTMQIPRKFPNAPYNSKFFAILKSNQMLVFAMMGKPEYPEKNLSEQSREPTNSAHI